MKLTPEFFENDPNWIRSKEDVLGDIIAFESNTNHIRESYAHWNMYLTVTFGTDNLTGGHGVYFHLDNGDHDSIASFDVETIEQANQILGVYNIRLSKDCPLYFDPTWAGDEVIAEFALPIVVSLLRKTNAMPPNLTWKEWRKILRGIIFALHQVAQPERMMDAHDWFIEKYGSGRDEYWPKWEEYNDRIQTGLENFGKCFTYLNW